MITNWQDKVNATYPNGSHGGGAFFSSKSNQLIDGEGDWGTWVGICKRIDAHSICVKAIYHDVVSAASHTERYDSVHLNVSVLLDCKNNVESHKRVLLFLIENDLIPKTKNGLLHNVHFKRYNQSKQNYTPKIALSDFVDLKTGIFIADSL